MAARLEGWAIPASWYVLFTMVIFSTQDTLSKLLVADYSPLQVAWFRFAINTALLAPFVLRARGRPLATKRPMLQLGRGLAVMASVLLFMAGLARMPLADATAINFIAPLIVTALSIPFLGEKVGVRRWSAVAIGFAGALIIIRPGSSAFAPAAVFPVLSATCWAFALVLTRRTRGSDAPLTTLVYSSLVGLVVSSACLPLFWQPLTARAIVLLVAVGVVSVVGHYTLILGYMRGQASALAPLAYTQMIWSTVAGALVFGTVPGPFTWVGAAIVVASGIYVLRRERIAAARREERG